MLLLTWVFHSIFVNEARLKEGELRIILPRIADRRGLEIEVPVES